MEYPPAKHSAGGGFREVGTIPHSPTRETRTIVLGGGKIGNAHCMLFKVKDVLSLLEEVRRNGPFQS